MAKPASKKLLVIRLSAMGDCAIAVPVLRRLIKAYPQLQISVLTKPFFKPIFETVPNITVIEADTKGRHNGFFGVVKLAFQLQKHHFHRVADLHNVLRSKILRFCFFFFGWKTAKIDKGHTEKKALTRPDRSKVLKPLKTSAERYVEVFQELGFPIDLSMPVTIEKPDLAKHLHDYIGHSSQKWLGLAPFAAHPAKTYPLDLMEKVMAELDQSGRYKLLLFGGGKRENDLLNNLSSKYKNAVCIAGNFTFKEELAIIANLDGMVSMDSGNGHLAALFDVPVLTLWGGTHPYAGFAPFNQPKSNQLLPDLAQYPLLPTSVFGKTQREGYEDAMRTITPQTVLNKIESLMEDRKK